MSKRTASTNHLSNQFPYTSEGAFYGAMYSVVSKMKPVRGYDKANNHEAIWGIMERAWKARSNFDPTKGKLEQWLYQLARNYICDLYDMAGRSECRENKDMEGYDYPFKGLSSEEKQEKEDKMDAIHWAIGQLPELDQHLILLYNSGIRGREIAAQLGLTENNVRTRISRIKNKMRDLLAHYEDGTSLPETAMPSIIHTESEFCIELGFSEKVHCLRVA